MKIVSLLTLSILFLSTNSIAQSNQKVKVYIHKQTGKMYPAYEIDGQAHQWHYQVPKYMFKQTADTVFFYIDENYDDDIPKRINQIETQNIGKKISLGLIKNLDGEIININELQGSVIVINIWGTWCAPCVKEIPELNRLTETYSEKKVVFIAPEVRSDRDRIMSFIERKRFNYQIVPDGDELASKLTMHYPTNIVIDKNGIVRFVKVGYDNSIYEILSEEIEKHL